MGKRGQTSCSEAAELLNFVFRENQKKIVCQKKFVKPLCGSKLCESKCLEMTSGG